MTLSLARALSSRQNSTASTPRASASPPATQRQIICPPFKPSPPDQQCPQHPELPSGRPDPPVLHLRQRIAPGKRPQRKQRTRPAHPRRRFSKYVGCHRSRLGPFLPPRKPAREIDKRPAPAHPPPQRKSVG